MFDKVVLMNKESYDIEYNHSVFIDLCESTLYCVFIITDKARAWRGGSLCVFICNRIKRVKNVTLKQ
jgi:hypothetical protein